MSAWTAAVKAGVKRMLLQFGWELRRSSAAPSGRFLKRSDRRVSYYETPIGNYYLPHDNPKDLIINCMKQGRLYDAMVIETAKEYIRPGTAVLDLGANFGQMTVEFSRCCGESGRVYSFEADPFIFGLLEKNVRANGCKNVTTVFGAVFDQDGKEVFYPEQDFKDFETYGSYGIDLRAKSGRPIRTLTVDSLKIEKKISFMKIDVQGCDYLALKGAERTIREHRMPILFEFEQALQNQFNASFQDYVDLVRSFGYKFERTIAPCNYLILPA